MDILDGQIIPPLYIVLQIAWKWDFTGRIYKMEIISVDHSISVPHKYDNPITAAKETWGVG